MKKVTVSGNGYYTDDSEYVVSKRGGKTTIRRGDGSRMIVPADQDAHEIAAALASGEKQDSDYEWSNE